MLSNSVETARELRCASLPAFKEKNYMKTTKKRRNKIHFLKSLFSLNFKLSLSVVCSSKKARRLEKLCNKMRDFGELRLQESHRDEKARMFHH